MSQQVNLFNPVFLKKEKYFSALTMLQGLGVILILGVVFGVWAGRQANNMRDEELASSARVKAAQADLMRIVGDPTKKKASPAEIEIRTTEAEIRGLQNVFDVLSKGDLGNTEGYSPYLKAFARQIVPGVWLTGFNIADSGNHIELRGRTLRAELVPAFVARLKAEPSMAGKTFATLEMKLPGKGEGNRPQLAAAYIEFNLQSEATIPEAGRPR